MPIQIKRPDVTEQIRLLAELTGVSLTDAVALAVSRQLAIEQVQADARLTMRRKAAEAALADLRRLPIVGPSIGDEDLYDSEGLPK
jgi:hypothetical protein